MDFVQWIDALLTNKRKCKDHMKNANSYTIENSMQNNEWAMCDALWKYANSVEEQKKSKRKKN